MVLSDISIKRPVLATVMSALIVVIGLAALTRLPVRELPDVDAAVVTVSTRYTGASPEVIDTDIVEIVEGAVSSIDGIKSLSSVSRFGSARTTVEFVPGRNIDAAANDVRDAMSRVIEDLPEEADSPEIVKADSDSQPIMRIAITSDRMSAAEISDYADRYIVDRLSTIEGIARVDIFGERRYAMRVWLDRRAMAARQVSVRDVEAALLRNNLELPAGEIRSAQRQFTVRTDTRLRSIEDFRGVVIKTIKGYSIRLGEIGDIELGVEDRDTVVRSDGREAVGLGILRQSQANTIAVSRLVRQQIELLRPVLPAGMDIAIASDDATFINASIREILIALGISMTLVILVIFLFLYTPRATLVPAVTIPVAVIGTFAFIHAFGFSINVLTLLALILAIGLVVDDAIIVIENVQRRVEHGESPVVAAYLGTRQVTFAVLATSVTLISVFVPISFLEGNVGRLFTEFGLVLAAAVLISTFVALTLCATLCSKVLHERETLNPLGRILERGIRAVTRAYGASLGLALRLPVIVLGIAAGLAVGCYALFLTVPKELTPTEDRGVFFIPISAPQGATVAYTERAAGQIERLAEELRKSGDLRSIFAMSGQGGDATRGFIVVRLVDWSERTRSQQEIIRSLAPQVAAVTAVRAFPVSPAGLGQRGSRTPLQIVIGGPDYESIRQWTDIVLERARDNPGLENLEIDFEPNRPQLNVAIDRRKADDLAIDIEEIGRTLQTMLASREVTNFLDRGREYPVILQARDEDRRTPTDLANIFIRSGNTDALIPLTALVSLNEVAASPELRRFDRLPSITISAALANGYTLGDAVRFMQGLAAELLPPEVQLGYAGQTREFVDATGGVLVTFGLALLIVYLVLAAQFESFVHPAVIMLGVPLAVFGALASLHLTGNTLNIYSQIGLILLVGLMAKNGILIVDFANQLRGQGRPVREAILEGSMLRFRPIVMTVVSTILGAVPLAIASGAGAESRRAIGIVIIGGLGFATVLTLYLTPVLYDLLARFARPANAVALDIERALERTRSAAE
ncbi:MAG: efflux RND transporter permease subunit [Dongiaceae bacterium]